jgi:hypothetical protein
MAAEARRGCGYRKVGGLYLVADGFGTHCCKIPFDLTVCPTCHAGIKQSRGWTWIDPRPFTNTQCTAKNQRIHCPLNALPDRVGLIWIGAEHYPSPGDFSIEVARMGLSRRIKAIPRGFKLGETWVLFAHPRGRFVAADDGVTIRTGNWIAQVFLAVQPGRIEQIVTDIMAKDHEAMAALQARGITPVIVPWNDPDHAARRKPGEVRASSAKANSPLLAVLEQGD